jgi:mRNA degradation ribonuclease J1/J2
MNAKDLSEAKDPDVRASLGALKRAAQLARQTAIQTETNIVIVKDGKMLRISADELRQQALAKESPV